MNKNSKNHIFYEEHSNFINRTVEEYKIAPGIKCKFDTILYYIGKMSFLNALDIGCSGNSIFYQMKNIDRKFFTDIAFHPLKQYKKLYNNSPICGSITNIPFKNRFFDLVTALDVLEHIEDDNLAITEIYRILNDKGILIVTVPHRKKYFTDQDIICGHYRRYEYDEIIQLFSKQGLKKMITFPIYGQFMRIQFLQRIDPKGTEIKLNKLREKYQKDLWFRKFWDFFVFVSSKLMRIDAAIQPFKKSMDICIIFKKG